MFKMKIKRKRMKILNTLMKALPRVYALLFFLLSGMITLAQTTGGTDTGNGSTAAADSSERWYDQGWVWFVIVIIAIILILALNRRSGNVTKRDQNRFKDRR